MRVPGRVCTLGPRQCPRCPTVQPSCGKRSEWGLPTLSCRLKCEMRKVRPTPCEHKGLLPTRETALPRSGSQNSPQFDPGHRSNGRAATLQPRLQTPHEERQCLSDGLKGVPALHLSGRRRHCFYVVNRTGTVFVSDVSSMLKNSTVKAQKIQEATLKADGQALHRGARLGRLVSISSRQRRGPLRLRLLLSFKKSQLPSAGRRVG